jgi:hypothetical protein
MSLSFASQQRVTEGSVPSQDGNHFIKYLKSISEYGLFTFRNSKFLTFTLTLHRRWRFPPTYPKGAYRPPLCWCRYLPLAVTVLAVYIGNAFWANGCVACAVTLTALNPVVGDVI